MVMLVAVLLVLGVVFMFISAFPQVNAPVRFDRIAWAFWGLAFTILHWPK